MMFPNLEMRPQQVSRFVGVPGSRLPRLTANTIGEATRPARVRGGTSFYTALDALLIRLGAMLLDMGLLPWRTQRCLREVRDWIADVAADPRLGSDDDEFLTGKFSRWLIGEQTPDGFDVELSDKTRLLEVLTADESAKPHMIVNLQKFVLVELKHLLEVVE